MLVILSLDAKIVKDLIIDLKKPKTVLLQTRNYHKRPEPLKFTAFKESRICNIANSLGLIPPLKAKLILQVIKGSI